MKNLMTCGSVLIVSLLLFSCGKETDGTKYVGVTVPGPTVTVTPSPSPVVTPSASEVQQEDIDAIVADENAYRDGLGQSILAPGLSCTLYTITGGQYIQNDASHSPTLTGIVQVATYLYSGVFNQPDSPASTGLNVLPPALAANATYQNLILLRCQGQLVVQTTDFYKFDLTSDDGSVLYLDNARLIDNDGNHAVTLKSGTKYLRRGVHVFRLDFAQTGAGNQALILQANGALIAGQYLYH